MRTLVLGAGVVGVAAAYYLARAGHQVTVVERRAGPGLETSFANGGQIAANHSEPWANPGTPAKVLKWLGRADAPILFRLCHRQGSGVFRRGSLRPARQYHKWPQPQASGVSRSDVRGHSDDHRTK